MKKQIQLEGEGLAALNNIVASASFTSRPDARKVHTLAQWLAKPMAAYKAALGAVQDEYGEEVTEDVPEGAPAGTKPKKKKIVPDDKVEAYQKAIEDARGVKYTVEMDRESFSFCTFIMDGLFEREEIKKQNGLAGVDQARNVTQISIALEEAVDVK